MKTVADRDLHRESFNHNLIFRALSTRSREFLFSRAELVEFDAGERIVAYGDLSPSFFAVLRGSVHISRALEGQSVYIDTLAEGSVFGEAAMFLKASRTADVTSADGCVVAKLTRFDLMDFLEAQPRDGNKILLALVYGLLLKLKSSSHELAVERAGEGKDDARALFDELTQDALG